MFAERPEQLPAALVLERLKPLLEDPAILKIGHNLKFDWVVFNRRGICLAPYDDTLVMSFNLDAGGLNSHSLDDLAKKHLDHDCIAFKDLCGTGQKQISFDKVQVDRATEYAAEDADVALRLWMRFRARLPFEKATRVYEMVDRPMVAVVGAMEAGRRQGRPRGAEEPVGRVQQPDRRAGGADLRRGRLQVHHRLAPSNWATSCSTRWAFRAAARASPAPGRPTSPSWSGCRARACRSPSWCSTGAS